MDITLRPSDSFKAYMSSFNTAVLSYAKAQLGQKIGDGQCWSLVDAVLQAAGAHRPNLGGYGPYVFGKQLGAGEAIKPGDIMQFEGAYFYHKDGNGWSDATLNHHTAFVATISGTAILLINQNAGGDGTVRYSSINLAKLQRGTVTTFRPQPK